MKKRLALFFSTGFYSGYAPFAPGTFGSIVGIVIFYLTKNISVELQTFLFLCYSVISYYSTQIAIRHFNTDDPSQVVCDEVIGMWLALIFLDLNTWGVLSAFVIFRILDITKPFPIRQVERKFRNAWGVLLDDIVAGIITKGIIWVIIR